MTKKDKKVELIDSDEPKRKKKQKNLLKQAQQEEDLDELLEEIQDGDLYHLMKKFR